MAQSKTRTKVKNQTSPDTRKWIIRGLIAVSLAINIVFLTLVMLVKNTSMFDYSMASLYVDRQIDGRGCIKGTLNTDPEKFGQGARVCWRTTVESSDGTIISPDTLKGQRYFTDEEWKRGLYYEELEAREK